MARCTCFDDELHPDVAVFDEDGNELHPDVAVALGYLPPPPLPAMELLPDDTSVLFEGLDDGDSDAPESHPVHIYPAQPFDLTEWRSERGYITIEDR